jgi:hypothetical protein
LLSLKSEKRNAMRFTFLFCFFMACMGFAFAQGEDNSLKGTPAKERIVTGGGFGLGFGNVQDYVSVSPVIGYAVTRKFLVGSGFLPIGIQNTKSIIRMLHSTTIQ